MYNTPNVISLWGKEKFSQRFGKYKTITEIDIFVEMKMHDTIIQVAKVQNRDLNIFEETILKLSKFQIFDTERICELIFIEKDLIEFIQNKLINSGYIDKNKCITNTGINYLNEQNAVEIESKLAQVFINNQNEISTYIRTKKPNYEYVDFYNGKIMEINVGSAGKAYNIKGDVLSLDKNTNNKSISQSELRKAIVKCNKFCKQESDKLYISREYGIDISKSNEIVYIHYKLAKLQGKAREFLVSDGFTACDQSLHELISRKYTEMIKKLDEKAHTNKEKVKSQYQNKEKDEIIKLLVAPNGNLEKSNEKENNVAENKSDIDTNIENKDLVHNKKKSSSNSDEEMRISKENNGKIAGYYSAIEICFYRYLKTIKVDFEMLKTKSFSQNSDFIVENAKNIGLTGCENYKKFFEISSNKISRFEEENAEMDTLISLMILHATQDKDSRVHSLIAKEKYFIKDLMYLKSIRDMKMHGGEDKLLSYNDIQRIYVKASMYIGIILPEYANLSIQNKEIQIQDDASDEIIRKDVELAEKLGTSLYYTFDEEIKECLRDIADFKEIETHRYITGLSKTLEIVFRKHILDLILLNIEKNNVTKQDIVDKINNEICDCPMSISTVNERNVKNALTGKPSTLGAYTIAIVAMSEKNEKFDIIIKIVDEILNLRKHGNDVNISVSDEKLKELQSKIFEIIKIIGEM